MKTSFKNIIFYRGLKNKLLLLILLFFIIIFISSDILATIQVNTWGQPKEKVMKEFILPNEKTIEFTPIKKPDYENKIMNMVNLILKNIENDINSRILIISTQSDPRKDFILFDNKLFSVMEYYNSISKENLSNVIKTLTKQYGEPNYNPGSEMDVYFISNKSTKVIVHYYIKTMKCEIYFYDSQLYHKLSSNEF